MSAFWKHYEAAKPGIAGAVDDVRHKLVEEGWFGRPAGRQVTGDLATSASSPEPEKVKGQDEWQKREEPTHKHYTPYDEVWGTESESTEIYPSETTEIEPLDIPPQTRPYYGPEPEL